MANSKWDAVNNPDEGKTLRDGFVRQKNERRGPTSVPWRWIILGALVLYGVIFFVAKSEACDWSWCTQAASTRSYITDDQRNRVGDLYKPSPKRRVQIRDKNRTIIGYIEEDGTITDTKRRKIGYVGE